jgi:tRNA(adenine34) deaminase
MKKSKHPGGGESIGGRAAPSWLEHAMAEALALAEKAAREDEVPVGAVVVERESGRIVGRGYNRREQDTNPLAHAELLAIEDASSALKSWRLEGCELVVTLEPCPMCLGACQQARLEKVFYGAPDPKGGAISLGFCLHEDSRVNHRFPAQLVQTPECGEILTAFFARKRGQK